MIRTAGAREGPGDDRFEPPAPRDLEARPRALGSGRGRPTCAGATCYQAGGDWNFELAALQGSSFLALPRPLAWVVGNANSHHVHHLSAKIAKYNLRRAHEEQALFARTPVVTIASSARALGLKLWDEERGSLVPFPRLSALEPVPRRVEPAA